VSFEELSARLGDAQAELERSRATIAAREDELGKAQAELDRHRGRIADKEGELGKARVELDQSQPKPRGSAEESPPWRAPSSGSCGRCGSGSSE